MTRLRFCAFGAFVITSTTAMAQDVPAAPTGTETGVRAIGLFTGDDVLVAIGQDKAAPLCPEFCAPRRVTSVAQATVGEREVLAYTTAAAAHGSKLHVDSRRSLWAQARKLPRTDTTEPASNLVTQGEFRPALDPVLADPTADSMK